MSPGASYSSLTGRLSAPISPSALRRDAGAGRCECLFPPAGRLDQLVDTGWTLQEEKAGLSGPGAFILSSPTGSCLPREACQHPAAGFLLSSPAGAAQPPPLTLSRPPRTVRAGFQPWMGEGSSRLFRLCMLFSAPEVVATYSWTSPKDFKFSPSPLSI